MSYSFTIGTPVFNRAHLLPRLYESLLKNHQEFPHFEWLLIDDGSTDDIYSFVQRVKADNRISFKYIKKSNEGKHSCLNYIFQESLGELTLILDSDDLLADNALVKVNLLWSELQNKDKIAGVIGLCTVLSNNAILGDKFPQSPMFSTLVANAYSLNMRGDRCDFVRTDLLKGKKFPIIPGEKFMSEAVVMLDFDIDYQYLCVNDSFKVVEYQSEGISNNFDKLSMKNPEGLVLRFERFLTEYALLKQINFKSKIKMYGNYCRYLLHSEQPVIKKLITIDKFYPIAFIAGCLAGTILYVKDKTTLRGL